MTLDDDSDDDDETTGAPAGTEHRVVVDPAHASARLDVFLAATTPLSRANAQRLVEDGHARVDAVAVRKPSHRLRIGAEVTVLVPPPVSIELVPEDIPLAVLFEDEEVIVVDKQAGLVVHPAPGHPRGTLVNALLFRVRNFQGIGGELRPGIVHRLDKGTSGVMVVAKTERALASLTAAFAAKSKGAPSGVSREYLGIAAPAPPGERGTIQTMYGRHPTDRRKFTSRVATGKAAITHWSVEERLDGGAAALVRFRLQTGRTHQIRVHAADQGWSLLGDPLYGRTPRELATIGAALGRQALHASTLGFHHPASDAPLAFVAPLPADFEAALRALATRSST